MHGKLGREIRETKMSLYAQPNLTGGIDSALTDVAESVPAFPIMILAFVFFIIFLGGTSNQKRRIGNADYPFWGVIASLTTTMLALIFTLTAGIINGTTLGIVIAITIMFGVWFFLSKTKGEQ